MVAEFLLIPSAALIFAIILKRRLRREPITRLDKLGILIGSIAVFYAMLAFFLGISPPNLSIPIAVLTAIIGLTFALLIYRIPIQVRIKGKKFEAEILDRRESYRRTEEVRFRTHYSGELTNGFYDNELFPPKGKQFGASTWTGDSGTTWSWDSNTLADVNFYTPGKLNGYVNYEGIWNWRIPKDAPTGEYVVYMRVYNHLGIGQRQIREQKETTFIVSD